ncbi:MAG: glyoxalase [Candidatus Kaiserbacteria bacterium]|nr:glyoxalase [Candidatus Kaiserbacteria bacterium]
MRTYLGNKCIFMIDHVSVYVDDLDKAKKFYAELLKPLGYALTADYAEYGVAGFEQGGKKDFWIGKKESAHNTHIAFAAAAKEAVDAFHAAALSAGAADNGAPGYRKDYAPGYYAAFVVDPFGNNIEAVFQDPTIK